MMQRMLQRMDVEVPETGDFETVEEGFDNPDKKLGVKRFWLEVVQPPEGVENREVKRALKLVAANHEGAEAEILLESGPKQDIRKALHSQDMEERIVRCVAKMDYNLRGR